MLTSFIVLFAATLFGLGSLGLPRPRENGLFTPAGLLVGYLAVATGLVPVLWVLGIATPWDEIEEQPYVAALFTLVCLLFFSLGLALGHPKVVLPKGVIETRRLWPVLLVGWAVGVSSYLALAAQGGGAQALLFSLADRRDLLSGTGPLRSLIVVSAVACIYGAWHRKKSRFEWGLTVLCGLTYVGSTLATGARYQALVLVIALVVTRALSIGVDGKFARRLLLAIAAVIPLSTAYGLYVRLRLTYGVEVELVDTTNLHSVIASTVGPFVGGGLDTIRTTGVVLNSVPSFSFEPRYLLGSVGNVVPRTIWPDKPPGAATQFSSEFFPVRWANGTGVPPSLFAESVVTFGLVGGLIALAFFGFIVARASAWASLRDSVFWRLLLPFLAADVMQLGKGGSDGFIRTLTLHLIAVAIVTIVATACGGVSRRSEGVPLDGVEIDTVSKVLNVPIQIDGSRTTSPTRARRLPRSASQRATRATKYCWRPS